MEIISWLLICSMVCNFIMFMNLNYKNRCIEDLEVSKSRMLRRKQSEILEILYHIQEMTDFRKTYSKEAVREYVNKKIELNTNTDNANV